MNAGRQKMVVGSVDNKVKRKKTERFNRAGVGVSPPFGFSTEPDLNVSNDFIPFKFV